MFQVLVYRTQNQIEKKTDFERLKGVDTCLPLLVKMKGLRSSLKNI